MVKPKEQLCGTSLVVGLKVSLRGLSHTLQGAKIWQSQRLCSLTAHKLFPSGTPAMMHPDLEPVFITENAE